MLPLPWVLALAAALFCIGLYAVLARRNGVTILMGVVLMLNGVIVTNTIRLNGYVSPKIKMVSIGSLLAEAIANIHNETSVSTLFLTPDTNPKARLMA